MKNCTAEELLKAGLSLLGELELFEDSNNVVYPSGNMMNLLDQVPQSAAPPLLPAAFAQSISRA
jgi:hypothetical protein